MKSIKVTMVFEFESEEADDEAIKEALQNVFEERADNDELLEHKTKVKVTDLDEEDDEPEYEGDEDEE